MFRDDVVTASQEPAVDMILRVGRGSYVPRTKAESVQRRLAVERAVDNVLEASFPASDPPSWTSGIAHTQPEHQVANADTVAADEHPAAPVREDAIDVSVPVIKGPTSVDRLVSLVWTEGVALLVAIIILLIGSYGRVSRR